MERVWLNSYPAGIQHDFNADTDLTYSSIGDFFYQTVDKYSSRVMLRSFGHTLTYETVGNKVQAFARYLKESVGLKAGDRIAIMLVNSPQFYVAFFAAMLLGVVVTLVNPLYTAYELRKQLEDSESSVLVVLDNFYSVVKEACVGLSLKAIVVTKIGDLLSIRGLIVKLMMRLKKKSPSASWDMPNVVFMSSILKKYAQKLQKPDPAIGLNHLALLQYTGGTTASPKGAILSHKNLLSNIAQVRSWCSSGLFSNDKIEKVVVILPLYHIFSLTANLLVMTSFGSDCLLIPNPKDFNLLIKEWSCFKGATFFAGVNALFVYLMKNPNLTKIDFSQVKVVLSGGSSLQESVATSWKRMTGTDITEAYGLTETSPAVCVNIPPSLLSEGSIATLGAGLPLPGTDVKIINPKTLDELGISEVGEICIKGPQVMQGYWRKEQETSEVFTEDGYFRTGDVGFIDDHGFVKIVDREKDIIIVAGFNVYPNEVEAVLTEHPNVLEAAVIGIDSPAIVGEMIKAIVVLKDPSISTTSFELKNFCRKFLTSYKIPRVVEISSEPLPKTNVGKVLRRALKSPGPV